MRHQEGADHATVEGWAGPSHRGRPRSASPAGIVVTVVATKVRVVTVREFRDRASEMLRAEGVVLITRDGKPAGFFLPWDQPELPDEIRRGIYEHLAGMARRELEAKGVTEEEVMSDFQASRRARR